ncbi:MAG TPA: metal ABC transporter permease [Bacteroidales bacterium]|jgi:manganese/zinc/iron transport system permease protein|nr:metal ABC transporter permease [Bacteroidales bacterium]
MNSAQIEIQIIASVVAVTCAIPGVFLVLRKMAMISDAISHSILPGIVLGFFVVQDLSSPLLVIVAALTGILTVVMVELINKTGMVKEDTAIGLVFPALFSIGVILIARNAGDVHLDTDAVLVGDLAFAPFDRFYYGNADLGPKSLWVMGSILLISVGFLVAFFKELKISTFDAGLAASFGFSPAVIHYCLMTLTSVTTVGAFDAVGAILVVALMIVPAAVAYLLTDNLKKMILLSILFGVFSALSGYWLAHALDVSISGSMATVLGIMFLIAFIIAPDKGLISVLIRQHHQKREYSLLTFLLHIKNHSKTKPEETKITHMTGHFNWQKEKANLILELALKNNMIELNDELITLTEKGDSFTREAFDYIVNNNKVSMESIEGKFLLFR